MTSDAVRPDLTSTHEVGRYQLVCEVTKSQLGALWVGQNGADLACVRRIPKTGIADDQLDWLSEVGWWAMELHHPNVARTSDVVMTDAELAVMSEYVEGECLRSLLRLASFKRKPLPARIGLAIAQDFLEAAAFAESHEDRPSLGGSYAFGGLVPDSVLVARDGTTRLLDLGLAGVIARIESMARHPEMTAYAAPELLGESDVDRRADVFSAGVMLHEMLTGRRLFVGANYAAVSERVKSLSIPRADASKPIGGDPVPAPVADFVARALERDPAARYDGAAAMLLALRDLGDDAVADHAEVAAFVEELAGTQLAMRRKTVERKTGAGAADRAAPPPPRAAAKATLLGIKPPPAPSAVLHAKSDSIHPDVLDEAAESVRFASEPPTIPTGDKAEPPQFTSEPPTVPVAGNPLVTNVLGTPAPVLDVPPPPASVLEAAGLDVPVPTAGWPTAEAESDAAPESLQPESLEPESLEPETLEPATLQPATLQPATPQPATLQPTIVEPEPLERADDDDMEAPAQSAVLERRKRAQKVVIGVVAAMAALLVLALIVSAMRKSGGDRKPTPAATATAAAATTTAAKPVAAPPTPAAPTAAETAASAEEPAASAAEVASAAPPEQAPAPTAAARAPAVVRTAPRRKPKPKPKFTPSGI